MCLSIIVHEPDRLLAAGTHEGFEWVVVKNNMMGFRCGYVKVTAEHPWFGADYHSIDAEVHGGLTFAEPDLPCGKGEPDDGYWVGFDCGHYGDASDPELAMEFFTRSFDAPGGVVRTQEYVEAECRSLCEQAKKALT